MALLLAPGFMCDADLWRDMADVLGTLGPLVHADLSLDPSIEAMAERALAGAPPRFVMVGFSMGGYVAREIVRQAHGRVSCLVLIATSARADTPEQERRKALHARQSAGQAFSGLSRAAVVSSLHPDRAGDDSLIARLQAMAARLGGEVFRRQCALARHADGDRLHEIQCPTLIVAGDKDRLRSFEEAEELQAGIAGSDLVLIEGTGHMLPLEAPERLAQEIVDWVKAIPARATADA